MSDPGSFLARWSRRKLGALKPGAGEEDRADAAPPAPRHGTAAGEMTPEEIAALPSLDDLTSETDLVQFLKAGVPPLLRKAALRRMWMLDPAIRDFVGEARDYSWDWNVEGGVPSFGPLLPTDDVEGTLRGMFSRLGPSQSDDAEADAAREQTASEEADDDLPADLPAAATTDEPALAAEEAAASVLPPRLPAPSAGDPLQLSVARPAPERGCAKPLPPRRHGAARPKLD